MSDNNNVFLCRFVCYVCKTLNSIDRTHTWQQNIVVLRSCVYLCCFIYFICHIWTKNFDYCLQLTRTFVSICLELIWINCDWLILAIYKRALTARKRERERNTHTEWSGLWLIEKSILVRHFCRPKLVAWLISLDVCTHARNQASER